MFAEKVLAAILLLPVSFLLLLFAILAWIETGAWPIFVQKRVGLYGDPFRMYKLRTMYRDADDQPVYDCMNDPRITRSGRILRRSHLDESLQLLNVLRGEMNLVGPRPMRPALFYARAEWLPEYTLRVFMRPGIIGLAQLRGTEHRRNEHEERSAVRQQFQDDWYYMTHRSLRLDLYIAWRTVLLILPAWRSEPESPAYTAEPATAAE
jgi:lipopolysaccharide/colanic/teichoic acid biosynthesis glycosyltransferase